MALNLREVKIFYPCGNEFPEQMLLDAGVSEMQLPVWQQAKILRVAKVAAQLLGVYAMDQQDQQNQQNQQDQQTFSLHGVVVASAWRKQGLGRWLTGHAIGVAESKGGRRVVLQATADTTQMFSRMGFSPDQAGMLCFDLLPE